MPLDTEVNLSDRLRSYLEAWTELNPEGVSSHYLEDGTHRGPGVVLLAPELPDATLRGATAIHKFVTTVNPNNQSLTYRVYWVLETESTSVVEYELMNPGRDVPVFAAEIITWSGNQVRSARAYTLSASF